MRTQQLELNRACPIVRKRGFAVAVLDLNLLECQRHALQLLGVGVSGRARFRRMVCFGVARDRNTWEMAAFVSDADWKMYLFAVRVGFDELKDNLRQVLVGGAGGQNLRRGRAQAFTNVMGLYRRLPLACPVERSRGDSKSIENANTSIH